MERCTVLPRLFESSSIERAREALGNDPQDNSAEWNGDDHVADTERKWA